MNKPEGKKITWTIEIRNDTIKFTPDNIGVDLNFAKHLDRVKDGILPPEIAEDMYKISLNLTREGSNGKRIGNYRLVVINLPANPKSSQKPKMRARYKKILIEQMLCHKNELVKFKGLKILVYIAIYLRIEKFESYDVDNFLKAIIDALKEYTGDDRDVVSVLAVKKNLEGYPENLYDFIEQTVVAVTTPDALSDISKK
jgi:Holliday junction resolvase RusA-like endonuclease